MKSDWYVLNVRDAEWRDCGPRGHVAKLVREDEAQVGVNLFVLGPGEPMAMYHWEADQEGFLVLSGEAILIIDGEERTIRQWDYVHCPAGTPHIFVGAGAGPCAILMVGTRPEEGLFYPVSEVAAKYGASVARDTPDPDEAYADWPGEFAPVRLPWPVD